MSYEKDKLDSYVTSASLATALSPYITSASVLSAIAGINLAPYVTSNSLSAAVATDTLTVRGNAAVSATLSAGAVTVAGRPVGPVLLGYAAGTARSLFAFSGSWSDFCVLQVECYIANGAGFMPVTIYTDGGTTPILTVTNGTSRNATVSLKYDCKVYGGDGQPSKMGWTYGTYNDFVETLNVTVTANTGFVNCLRISITGTASYAMAALYGWRKA